MIHKSVNISIGATNTDDLQECRHPLKYWLVMIHKSVETYDSMPNWSNYGSLGNNDPLACLICNLSSYCIEQKSQSVWIWYDRLSEQFMWA